MYRGNSSMSYVDYINHSENISICVKALTLYPNAEITMLHILRLVIVSFWKILLPLSNTGRWRNLPLCMICKASTIAISTVADSGFCVITYRIIGNKPLRLEKTFILSKTEIMTPHIFECSNNWKSYHKPNLWRKIYLLHSSCLWRKVLGYHPH